MDPKIKPNIRHVYAFKKCPFCSSNLNMEDKVCYSCKKKVGECSDNGIAKKPFPLKAYITSIFAWFCFAYYIWWAFIKDAK